MIIDAILNNNAVVVRRDKRDIIVVERGIGFHAKKGDQLTLQDSMKIYVPEDCHGDDCQLAR